MMTREIYYFSMPHSRVQQVSAEREVQKQQQISPDGPPTSFGRQSWLVRCAAPEHRHANYLFGVE
jgi:hypothetical protein